MERFFADVAYFCMRFNLINDRLDYVYKLMQKNSNQIQTPQNKTTLTFKAPPLPAHLRRKTT